MRTSHRRARRDGLKPRLKTIRRRRTSSIRPTRAVAVLSYRRWQSRGIVHRAPLDQGSRSRGLQRTLIEFSLLLTNFLVKEDLSDAKSNGGFTNYAPAVGVVFAAICRPTGPHRAVGLSEHTLLLASKRASMSYGPWTPRPSQPRAFVDQCSERNLSCPSKTPAL